MAKSRAGRKKDALAALNPEPVEGGSDSESQSNDETKLNKAKAILNPIPKQNSDEEAEPNIYHVLISSFCKRNGLGCSVGPDMWDIV